MNLDKIMDVTKKASYEAGLEILKIYNSDFEVDYKEDDSPLTKADTLSNEILIDHLKQFNIPILSEESRDDLKRLDSEYVFIIDPLDGTKEFVKKNGEFTVNVGLVKNNKAILGVIYAPVLDELYFGYKGDSYRKKGDEITQLSVSSVKEIGDMSLVKSRSHASEKVNKISSLFKETTSSGSSLKGCLVAKGESDCYIRINPINEWDICAMCAIINNANGISTYSNGKEIQFNQKDTLIKGFVVSNGKNHDEIINLVK